jgi:hypothetical protein
MNVQISTDCNIRITDFQVRTGTMYISLCLRRYGDYAADRTIVVRVQRSRYLSPQRPRQLWVPHCCLPNGFQWHFTTNKAAMAQSCPLNRIQCPRDECAGPYHHNPTPNLGLSHCNPPPLSQKKTLSFLQRMRSDRLQNVGASSNDVGIASVADFLPSHLNKKFPSNAEVCLNNIKIFRFYITENTWSPLQRSIGSYC